MKRDDFCKGCGQPVDAFPTHYSHCTELLPELHRATPIDMEPMWLKIRRGIISPLLNEYSIASSQEERNILLFFMEAICDIEYKKLKTDDVS